MKLEQYTATVTVDNGATTGKESAIAMPTNFIPLACAVVVTVAATNAVNLDDVGSDADTDGYLDGIGSNIVIPAWSRITNINWIVNTAFDSAGFDVQIGANVAQAAGATLNSLDTGLLCRRNWTMLLQVLQVIIFHLLRHSRQLK